HISGCYLGSQLCICTFILSLRPACTPRSPYTTLFRSLSRPEVRYARAAAAERLGDSQRVVELLKGLESQLPLLADSIREKRARAAVEAGDPAETLAYFADRKDPESQLLAARAEAALGDRRKASARLTAMLRTLSRRANLCNLEAPARALLATVLEPDDTEGARRELRWLAVRAATCE